MLYDPANTLTVPAKQGHCPDDADPERLHFLFREKYGGASTKLSSKHNGYHTCKHIHFAYIVI